MIAFGGAAPLHAGRLCEKLGIARCLVPPGAGVGSAIGFLRAPFSFEANRSVYMRLDAFDAAQVGALLSDLRAEATAFVRSCDAHSDILAEYKVYMRYVGQGWEIPVILTEAQAMNPDPADFLARFEDDYTRLFGRPVAGLDVEITVWSVNATTPKQDADAIATMPAGTTAKSIARRSIFDAAQGTFADAQIVERKSLTAGSRATGPAAIVEDETTIIVPIAFDAICQPDGCIDLRRTGDTA